MRKRVIPLVLGIVLFGTGYTLGNYNITVVHAQFRTRTIPKSWGHCIGALSGIMTALIFEDGSGVIRLVTPDGQMQAQIDRN